MFDLLIMFDHVWYALKLPLITQGFAWAPLWGYDGIWITRSKMIQAWQGGQARGSTFLELKELAFQSEGASNRAAQQQHTAVPGWFLDGFWMVSGWFLVDPGWDSAVFDHWNHWIFKGRSTEKHGFYHRTIRIKMNQYHTISVVGSGFSLYPILGDSLR